MSEIAAALAIVSPEGVREFAQEFWQDYLDYAPMIGIECRK